MPRGYPLTDEDLRVLANEAKALTKRPSFPTYFAAPNGKEWLHQLNNFFRQNMINIRKYLSYQEVNQLKVLTIYYALPLKLLNADKRYLRKALLVEFLDRYNKARDCIWKYLETKENPTTSWIHDVSASSVEEASAEEDD
jgi:hypothetical protein